MPRSSTTGAYGQTLLWHVQALLQLLGPGYPTRKSRVFFATLDREPDTSQGSPSARLVSPNSTLQRSCSPPPQLSKVAFPCSRPHPWATLITPDLAQHSLSLVAQASDPPGRISFGIVAVASHRIPSHCLASPSRRSASQRSCQDWRLPDWDGLSRRGRLRLLTQLSTLPVFDLL